MKLNNIIKHFHIAPMGPKLDPQLVMMEAAKRGYVVHPDCATQEVLDFVRSETFNPNSTFYKTWKDVTDKSRFELFIDQLIHYSTTYGTDLECEVYCPNGDPINLNYKTYTVIRPVTEGELFERLINILGTDIALSTDLVTEMVEYIAYCVKTNNWPFDMDGISNREAQIMLCDALGIMPLDGDDIVRYLHYKLFKSAMVINSKAVRHAMYAGCAAKYCDAVNLTGLTDEQIINLAKVFNRHKVFLLGLKKNPNNVTVINKVSRLSKKYHEPMEVGFWEKLTILPESTIKRWAPKMVGEMTNMFKIVRLIQMIDIRKLQNTTRTRRVFMIRNGKSWIDENKFADYNPVLDSVRGMLYMRLVELLKAKRLENVDKVCTVRYPAHLDLVCPVSEKKFMGNVPFGSRFTLADHDAFFGVHWRGEDGTDDFDLSFLNIKGDKIGWDADFTDNGMVFSGDMTRAEPEAVEMFSISNGCPDGVICLNRFNGVPNSKFRLFFGQEHIEHLELNYMVNPDNIVLNEVCESTADQQMLGLIIAGTFVPMFYDMAGGAVSVNDINFIRTMQDYACCFLDLRRVLCDAGYSVWSEDRWRSTYPDGPHIDLTDLKKDTLITLFS